MHVKSLSVALALLLLSSLGSVARLSAQDATDPQAQAMEHFNIGVNLYNEGNYDAALVEFLEAYRLAPSWRIRYNIGQIHYQLGEYAKAIEEFRRYLKEGSSELSDERREFVEKSIAQLRTRIGSISVQSNVEGANVQLDGEDIGKAPLKDFIVDIGRHRIVVEAEGYQRVEKVVHVTADGTEELNIALQKIQYDASGKPIIITKVEKEKTPWLLIIAGSVAGVAAISTGVFGGLALITNNELDGHLAMIPGDEALIRDAKQKLKLYALVADISGGVTIAAGALTLIALLTAPRQEDAETAPPATTLLFGPSSVHLRHRF